LKELVEIKAQVEDLAPQILDSVPILAFKASEWDICAHVHRLMQRLKPVADLNRGRTIDPD
jgi:hypothetical protein